MTGARGGLAAAIGGTVWAGHAVLLAARPPGCIGDACSVPGASSRPSEDLAPPLLVAVVLLAVAATALSRSEPRSARAVARAGAALLWAGVALLGLGLAVNAVVEGDSPFWWLHDTDSLGRLFPVAGSFLVGLALLRLRSAPGLLGAALAAAALTSVPFNAQDDRVLLDLPLGVVWTAVGLWWLLRARRRSPPPPGNSRTSSVGRTGDAGPLGRR